MSANLTKDEARTRAALITVASYHIDLDLTGDATTFGSVSVIRFGCRTPGAGTFVDLAAPAVRRIELNGRPLNPAAFDRQRISLTELAEENVLVIEAQCAYSRTGAGLHRFTDPADGLVYLYTDLEPFDAHHVYACFDQPDLKARFEFAVATPVGWTAVSNLAPEACEQAAGALHWRFPPTPPIPTYITAVAAGPYHVARAECDNIDLGVLCRQSLARYLDSAEIFEITRQGLEFFQATFGIKYPFGKYDQLFVPEFKGGAMENPGAITYTEQFLFRSRVTDFAYQNRAETILHEMAHMWFGNLVTMRWWDDLWLNESFATWAGTLAAAEATGWTSAWTTFAQVSKAWAYRQDQMATTHPIAADIPDIAAVEVNFDGITYAKGAAVLKQLVAYTGPENFLAGLRAYFAAYSWGNATLVDLLRALTGASGRDLSAWSREWLETAGVNTLRPVAAVGPDGRFTSFAIIQEAPAAHPVLRSHRLAIGCYRLSGGTLDLSDRYEVDVTGKRTEVPQLAGTEQPDLVLVNDEDLTYAKIRLDPRSLKTVVSSIGLFTRSLPAAMCWSAAWDMCRDGEMPARDYVRMVASGIAAVTDISMAQALLGQAGVATRRYADPVWQTTGLDLLAGTLHRLTPLADAGSDLQHTYLRALAGFAITADHLSFLAGLLDGTTELPRLVIDTELRWALLTRLVSRGIRGDADIAAELALDATDAGQRHASAARAAIPSAEAKRAAWDRLTAGDLPLAVFRAVLAGFSDPDQRTLTEPYLDDYFAAAGSAWHSWPTVMAQDFVAGVYMVCPFSQRTVDATDAYLATADPPGALRRLLAEGRDDVLRTMRGRACDRRLS